MEVSSARSASSRTASPALIPAAVRSSCARSMRSIQRSSADSSRYCWLTMPCHSAPSTSRSPAASALNAAPYCTLPGDTGSHRMSSSADRLVGGGAAVQRRLEQHALAAPDAEREGVLQEAERRVPGVVLAAVLRPRGRPASGYRYSSRSGIRRSTHSRRGRPTRVCRGPSTGPSSRVPGSRRPRKCQWPCVRRVDREQVERAAHDEPQHLRPLQRTGCADPRSRPGAPEARRARR